MQWRDSLLGRRLGVRLPLIQSPMAGGASTARLTAAVSEAGGLGSVAGGLLSPDDLRAAIRDVRVLTDRIGIVACGQCTRWPRSWLTRATPAGRCGTDKALTRPLVPGGWGGGGRCSGGIPATSG